MEGGGALQCRTLGGGGGQWFSESEKKGKVNPANICRQLRHLSSGSLGKGDNRLEWRDEMGIRKREKRPGKKKGGENLFSFHALLLTRCPQLDRHNE